tara:strand:+ start:4958 stop:5554 length:597 start_codon:yes stop_codon:yes gene_type:complete
MSLNMGIIQSQLKANQSAILSAAIGFVITSGWLTFAVDELNEELCDNSRAAVVEPVVTVTFDAGKDSCKQWGDRGNYCNVPDCFLTFMDPQPTGKSYVRGEAYELERNAADTNHATCCFTAACLTDSQCSFETGGLIVPDNRIFKCSGSGFCVESECGIDDHCMSQSPMGLNSLCANDEVICNSSLCQCGTRSGRIGD